MRTLLILALIVAVAWTAYCVARMVLALAGYGLPKPAAPEVPIVEAERVAA